MGSRPSASSSARRRASSLIGLVFLAFELHRFAGGVGDLADEAEFAAQIVDSGGQQARLDDDDRRGVFGEQLVEVLAVGGEELEAW
jgi:hypothetical protein